MITGSLWEAMHTTQHSLEEVKVEFFEQYVMYYFYLTSALSTHEFVLIKWQLLAEINLR